jgi:hypothetical protein
MVVEQFYSLTRDAIDLDEFILLPLSGYYLGTSFNSPWPLTTDAAIGSRPRPSHKREPQGPTRLTTVSNDGISSHVCTLSETAVVT